MSSEKRKSNDSEAPRRSELSVYRKRARIEAPPALNPTISALPPSNVPILTLPSPWLPIFEWSTRRYAAMHQTTKEIRTVQEVTNSDITIGPSTNRTSDIDPASEVQKRPKQRPVQPLSSASPDISTSSISQDLIPDTTEMIFPTPNAMYIEEYAPGQSRLVLPEAVGRLPFPYYKTNTIIEPGQFEPLNKLATGFETKRKVFLDSQLSRLEEAGAQIHKEAEVYLSTLGPRVVKLLSRLDHCLRHRKAFQALPTWLRLANRFNLDGAAQRDFSDIPGHCDERLRRYAAGISFGFYSASYQQEILRCLNLNLSRGPVLDLVVHPIAFTTAINFVLLPQLVIWLLVEDGAHSEEQAWDLMTAPPMDGSQLVVFELDAFASNFKQKAQDTHQRQTVLVSSNVLRDPNEGKDSEDESFDTSSIDDADADEPTEEFPFWIAECFTPPPQEYCFLSGVEPLDLSLGPFPSAQIVQVEAQDGMKSSRLCFLYPTCSYMHAHTSTQDMGSMALAEMHRYGRVLLFADNFNSRLRKLGGSHVTIEIPSMQMARPVETQGGYASDEYAWTFLNVDRIPLGSMVESNALPNHYLSILEAFRHFYFSHTGDLLVNIICCADATSDVVFIMFFQRSSEHATAINGPQENAWSDSMSSERHICGASCNILGLESW